MYKWVNAGFRHVRILLQIIARIEERTRIAPLGSAKLKIVTRDVDRRLVQVRVSLPIPNRVQQGRLAQEANLRAWIPGFPFAIQDIMYKWVNAGFRHVR